MINSLKTYIRRSIPAAGCFVTGKHLQQKVRNDGTLLPYYGNTVVYRLDRDSRAQLRLLQDSLYACAPELLAQPLDADTFHMTVHDLVNGPMRTVALQIRIAGAEEQAFSVLKEVCPAKALRMKTTWMFNMVNTSIVLGLEPADSESYEALDRMYLALEEVVPLGYDLTPHITLAYFKPGVYDAGQMDRLRQALKPVELEILLRPENLEVQFFRDMNTYETRKPLFL